MQKNMIPTTALLSCAVALGTQLNTCFAKETVGPLSVRRSSAIAQQGLRKLANEGTPNNQSQAADCGFGEGRPLHFKITLDEEPEDLSWFLVCPGASSNEEMDSIWDSPRGALAGHPGQVVEERTCIPYGATCTFNMFDSEGDGLTQGSGYTLTLGVNIIDMFAPGPFSEKAYCIGDLCGETFNEEEKPNGINGKEEHLQAELHGQGVQQDREEMEQLEEDLENLEHKKKSPQRLLVVARRVQVPLVLVVALFAAYCFLNAYYFKVNGQSATPRGFLSPMKYDLFDDECTEPGKDGSVNLDI